MFRLHSEITISNTTLQNSVVFVEVETSWQNLIDTCTLRFPNNFKRDNQNITVGDDGFFKRRDTVEIKIGYFPNLITVFKGFVRTIFIDTEVVMECEDTAYLLKQKTVTLSLPNESKDGKLQTLIDEMTSGVDIETNAVEANLGKFRISNATPLQALEELNKTYGLISFIRDEVLRSGLAYYVGEGSTVDFDAERNVADSSQMEFIDNSEILITIKGVSMQKDNTKIERFAYYDSGEIKISATDPGTGETELLGLPNLSESELDFYIEERLKNRLSTGVRGSFLAFLEPNVEHGDVVTWKDRKFPEREGSYLVKKVVKSYGNQGAFQQVFLDTKVS